MANSLHTVNLYPGVDFPPYEFREFPKAVRISRGVQTITETTDTIKGTTLTNTYQKEVFDEVIVNDAAEEAAVRRGAPTSSQVEDERLALITEAEQYGLKIDRRWSTERIRGEMDRATAPA